jgi:ribosomal protein S18 acetylase RimI-like enzyme
MSVKVRTMAATDADAVAAMVAGLARDTGAGMVPQLTGPGLLAARDLIDVVVAEEDGRLVGACLSLMTFSTWRGARGLYVVDLFVEPQQRGRHTGQRLLREATARAHARGARFVKLEVDESNAGAGRFYARLGFHRKQRDQLHILEHEPMTAFIATGEET